ncbi:hypothetical protein AKJ09_05485 [Labilithrix luteola]|uniref:Uncharacterized protein n=1 Tax=Labilithrix luteola TaxID=1391654 RepID=A0A0K1PZL6_9BACT|nr:hypothetical protein AKJ09_05485 [Labilithrix luteola]
MTQPLSRRGREGTDPQPHPFSLREKGEEPSSPPPSPAGRRGI